MLAAAKLTYCYQILTKNSWQKITIKINETVQTCFLFDKNLLSQSSQITIVSILLVSDCSDIFGNMNTMFIFNKVKV